MVDVIRLLLGGGDVLGPDRRELHDLVTRGEDVHQRRHQPFDRIGDVARDRLRAAVWGRHVLRHVAHVVVERGRAFIRELACRHGRERVVTLSRKQGLEIAGGHFSHFATIAALSADPRESVLESHREDRGLSGARKAILPRRCRREEARGIETAVNA